MLQPHSHYLTWQGKLAVILKLSPEKMSRGGQDYTAQEV